MRFNKILLMVVLLALGPCAAPVYAVTFTANADGTGGEVTSLKPGQRAWYNHTDTTAPDAVKMDKCVLNLRLNSDTGATTFGADGFAWTSDSSVFSTSTAVKVVPSGLGDTSINGDSANFRDEIFNIRGIYFHWRPNANTSSNARLMIECLERK